LTTVTVNNTNWHRCLLLTITLNLVLPEHKKAGNKAFPAPKPGFDTLKHGFYSNHWYPASTRKWPAKCRAIC